MIANQIPIVITANEVVASRFLLLTFGAAFLFVGLAVYAHFEVASWQESVDLFLKSPAVPGFSERADAAAKMRELWADREEEAVWLAFAVVMLSQLLFYSIRWGLTGRLRPVWLLQ
jgi:hypothetical protein